MSESFVWVEGARSCRGLLVLGTGAGTPAGPFSSCPPPAGWPPWPGGALIRTPAEPG